jgi:hypothetical protein
MNYWLNLFTGTTWQEFQKDGARVSGFRDHAGRRAEKVKPDDIFLCYMVGVKRWVGLLEITSEQFRDESRIFSEETFPVRFRVKPLVMLAAEQGVPMESLFGKLTFFQPRGVGHWIGHVRSSLTRYDSADAEVIATAIREAAAHPVDRPVDQRQLTRSANLYKLRGKSGDEEIDTVVSVPTAEEDEADEAVAVGGPTHTEIQWRLLDLGSQIGLKVWAPKSDRTKAWGMKRVSEVPSLLHGLPAQFDKVTNQTIENIDVLWMADQTIVAAFEVEHTTSIYSGLLRMSDLVTMQPNLDIKFYLAAPDGRYEKFRKEIARATFSYRKKPLHTLCRFLPYSKLCARLDEARNVIRYLRPEFLDEIASLYDPVADLID